MLMHAIRDGIIIGALERTKVVCGVCNEGTCGIHITRIALPEGIEPSTKLIAYNTHFIEVLEPYEFLGIGCGCYARFHRQIAHVQDAMRSRASRS